MIWQELVPVGTRAAPAVMSQLETYVIWREIWPARVWQGDSLAPTWPGMFSDLVQNQGEAIQTPLLPYPCLQYPPRRFKRHQFVIHTTLSENFILAFYKLWTNFDLHVSKFSMVLKNLVIAYISGAYEFDTLTPLIFIICYETGLVSIKI